MLHRAGRDMTRKLSKFRVWSELRFKHLYNNIEKKYAKHYLVVFVAYFRFLFSYNVTHSSNTMLIRIVELSWKMPRGVQVVVIGI